MGYLLIETADAGTTWRAYGKHNIADDPAITPDASTIVACQSGTAATSVGGYCSAQEIADLPITSGNWKVAYFDGSGARTELALGADGTYLKSNGAASPPTFATPGGGGDALTTNPLSQFAATTSAQLYGVLSDETGSATGTPLAVFNQAPQIDNIELGAASDTTLARSAAGRITVETKRLSYLGTTTTESATSHTLAAGDDVLFLSWTNTDAKTYTIATGTAAANDEWTGCNNGGTEDLTVVQGSGMTLIGNLIFHPGECYMIKFTSTTTANVIGGASS